MRKILLGLLLAAACSRNTTIEPAAGSQGTGPRPALDAFLAAVHGQDLQALSTVWGDKDGAIRDNEKIGREELERRELIMMCYFKHDRYRVLGEAPATGGERVMQVELTKGTLTRTTNFYLARGATRWYVRTADMEPVRDLCTTKQPQAKPKK